MHKTNVIVGHFLAFSRAFKFFLNSAASISVFVFVLQVFVLRTLFDILHDHFCYFLLTEMF